MMSTSEHQYALPEELDAPQSKLVYMTLLVAEEATASELQQQLGLTKLTLLSVLESLIESDFARRTEEGYAVR